MQVKIQPRKTLLETFRDSQNLVDDEDNKDNNK